MQTPIFNAIPNGTHWPAPVLAETPEQHERASVADRETQQRAKQFLAAGESTPTTHWLPDRTR